MTPRQNDSAGLFKGEPSLLIDSVPMCLGKCGIILMGRATFGVSSRQVIGTESVSFSRC
jgi:hypothetical protein